MSKTQAVVTGTPKSEKEPDAKTEVVEAIIARARAAAVAGDRTEPA